MLSDDIRAAIKNMKKLDLIENAAQNAERRAKNDKDFSTLVSEFTMSTIKLSEANKMLGFSIDQETLLNIEEGISRIESVISSSTVDESELLAAKQHFSKKVSPSLSREWREFHQKKTAGLSAKLSSLGGLVQNPNQIGIIREQITKGADWIGLSLKEDGQHTRLEMLADGINQVGMLENKLNLSDEIKGFILQVTSGKARVTDVTPVILDWIKRENLGDNFVISFRNNKL